MTSQILFIVLALCGAAYFVWRWKIDPLTVGFLACCVYFMPGFAGVAGFSYALADGQKTFIGGDLIPMTYAVMGLVMASTILGAAIVDRVPAGNRISLTPVTTYLPHVLLGIAIFAGVISIKTVGAYYLCADKNLTLSKIDIWYYFAAYAVPTCLAVAVASRRWVVAGAAVILTIADIYIGFRATAAVGAISLLVLFGSTFFRGPKGAAVYILVAVVAVVSLFAIKQAIYTLKYSTASNFCALQIVADYHPSSSKHSAATRQIVQNAKIEIQEHKSVSRAAHIGYFSSTMSRLDTYKAILLGSEPFVIQTTLNEVVKANFKISPSVLVGQLSTGVPGGKTIFGIDAGSVKSFNELYKPALFTEVNFGLANSPWAEAYAAGGLALVAIFAAIYSAILALLSYCFVKFDRPVQAIAAVIAGWFGFYFQRNDLLVQVGIMKEVVYIIIVAAALSAIFFYARRLWPSAS